MSTIDDFFAKMYDQNTGSAICLHCDTPSKGTPGGKWVSDNLWVCKDHIATQEQEEAERDRPLQEAIARIDAGTHTNADLALVVRHGLAYNTYDGEGRPDGIKWITPRPAFGSDVVEG